MISHEQVRQLLGFDSRGFPVTSLYLAIDLGRAERRKIELEVKNIVKHQSVNLERQAIDPAELRSLQNDFTRIENFIAERFDYGNRKGLAIFSCWEQDFWQVYGLPQRVRTAVYIDYHPYTRPLLSALDQYQRYCTVVVDRSKANIYEVFLGEIEDRSDLSSEVPQRVRRSAAGWYGLEERRVERHIDDHIHRHYKQVADIVFRFFKRYHFDWLILGGHEESLVDFEVHLHSYLRQRVAGRFIAQAGLTPAHEVLEKSLAIEREVEKRHGEALVREALDRAAAGGLAVFGLEATLKALNSGQVRTLLLSESFERPGIICSKCGFLGLEERLCPVCSSPTLAVPDIIEEAAVAAIEQDAQVKHITNSALLEKRGMIGALLRFK